MNTFIILLLFSVCKVIGQFENVPFNEHDGCTPCCPDPTCQNRHPEECDNLNCLSECIPQFRCDEGFLRDETTKICVLPRDCPNIDADKILKNIIFGDLDNFQVPV